MERPPIMVEQVELFHQLVGMGHRIELIVSNSIETIAIRESHLENSHRMHVWYIYIYAPTFG